MAARGYAIYRQRPDWDMSGPKGVVTVLELTGLDPVAEQTLWEWIFGIDLIVTIRGWRGPAPHPLQLMVTEPRRLGTTVTDGLWLRIVDLRGALEARRYRGPGALVIELTDEFCPWNQGRWRLSVEAGDPAAAATIVPAASTDEVDLALDTSDLAATYLGAYRFADLARAGRLAERRPGAVATADVLFATGRAAVCATPF
jgi:predicted acetyltransferase